MYQSRGLSPSGRRARTPAATAASAVVTRSTPSAPRPRRRSHSAATPAATSDSFALTSTNSTKSFWVPWPWAKITCSGYVAPGPHRGVDSPGVGPVEPADAVIPPEPRPLPAHVAPGRDERLLTRAGQCRITVGVIQSGDHLGVAQRPRRRHAVTQVAIQQVGHLVDQPRVEHVLGARRQPCIELICLPIQSDDHSVPAWRADGRCGRRKRATGQLHDLQGPDDPAPIGGQDRFRRRGVHPRQLAVQLFDADLREPLLPARGHGGVRRGKSPVVQQRLDVEHGSAGDDGHRAVPEDGVDVRGGAALVVRDGRGLGHVEHVQLMVCDAAPLLGGQLRGPDVHTAVELHRVGIHDLAAHTFGNRERQLRLAGARRPDDRDRSRHGCQTPAKYPTPNGAPRYSSFAERGAAPTNPAITCHPTRPVIDVESRLSAATSPAASASSSADCTATEAGSWPPGAGCVSVLAPSATTSTPTGSSAWSISDRSCVPHRIASCPLWPPANTRTSARAPGLTSARTHPVISALNGRARTSSAPGAHPTLISTPYPANVLAAVGATTSSVGPTPIASHRPGSALAAANTACRRSDSSAAAVPTSCGTSTGADGMSAIAVNTSSRYAAVLGCAVEPVDSAHTNSTAPSPSAAARSANPTAAPRPCPATTAVPQQPREQLNVADWLVGDVVRRALVEDVADRDEQGRAQGE